MKSKKMKYVGLLVAGAMMIGNSAMAQGQVAQEVNREVQAAMHEMDAVLGDVDNITKEQIRFAVKESTASGLEAAFGKHFGIEDDGDDDNDRRRRRFKTEDSWNLELGLNNFTTGILSFPADNEPYTLDTWGSRYVAITRNYSTKLLGPLYVEYGASISWYNFMFQDPAMRAIETDSMVIFEPEPATTGVNYIKDKLMAPYVNVHIVPVIDLSRGTFSRSYQGNGLRVGAGGYVGYRIGGRQKSVYEENGDRQKIKDKDDFDLETLRYGVRGQVGFRGVDLFVNYDLNGVFTENRGPDVNAISFGLIF